MFEIKEEENVKSILKHKFNLVQNDQETSQDDLERHKQEVDKFAKEINLLGDLENNQEPLNNQVRYLVNAQNQLHSDKSFSPIPLQSQQQTNSQKSKMELEEEPIKKSQILQEESKKQSGFDQKRLLRNQRLSRVEDD